jgi:hypothetical protein
MDDLSKESKEELSLLSDKSLSELLELTVGDIVEFIETSI